MTADASPQQAPPPAGPFRFAIGLLRDWGIALIVVVAVFAVWNTLLTPRPLSQGPAPAFTLPDVSGGEVSLSDFGDDLVVLNFWFTTCGPCRHEIPELAAFHEEHPEIPLLGLSTDRGMPAATLKRKSEKLGINYPVLHDEASQVAAAYGVSLFPTTVVIARGEIQKVRMGEVNRRSLWEMVEGY